MNMYFILIGIAWCTAGLAINISHRNDVKYLKSQRKQIPDWYIWRGIATIIFAFTGIVFLAIGFPSKDAVSLKTDSLTIVAIIFLCAAVAVLFVIIYKQHKQHKEDERSLDRISATMTGILAKNPIEVSCECYMVTGNKRCGTKFKWSSSIIYPFEHPYDIVIGKQCPHFKDGSLKKTLRGLMPKQEDADWVIYDLETAP